MGVSVLESIAENILTTINGIQLPNILDGNSDPLTLTAYRAKLINDPQHLVAIIYQLSPESGDDLVAAEQWQQSFCICTFVIPDDGDTTPIDKFNNDISASIHKALMTDPTRGGYAQDTTVKPPEYFPPENGEYAGVVFNFDVLYLNRLDNPYLSP